MTKNIRESIGFYYLLTEIQLYKIRNKSITHNIFRMQDNDFIICPFCYIVLREKCPNTEFFLVPIFVYLD